MKKYFLIWLLPVFMCCVDLKKISVNELVEKEPVVIKIENVKKKVLASQLIDEFFFLPLETNEEALLGEHLGILIDDDLIFVHDKYSSKLVCIFKKTGDFITSVGHQGGGPDEIKLLAGMGLDRENKNLYLYDNMGRKFMVYSYNGEFLKHIPLNFRFNGYFGILPSGNTICAINKNDKNTHLELLDDYRLIYNTSKGEAIKGGYKFDDNKNLPLSYTQIFDTEEELLYYPLFNDQICVVNDSTVELKYLIDYSMFTPMDWSKIAEFQTVEDIIRYEYETTWLFPQIAETADFLYFKTQNKLKSFHTFYNKKTGKKISFEKIGFDMDLFFNLEDMFSHKGYFIALVQPQQLIAAHEYFLQLGIKTNEKNKRIFENLKEDDNPVLVFFKLKELRSVGI